VLEVGDDPDRRGLPITDREKKRREAPGGQDGLGEYQGRLGRAGRRKKGKDQLGWAMQEEKERGKKRKREWAGHKEKKREKRKCI
jgi:hypothetical protein